MHFHTCFTLGYHTAIDCVHSHWHHRMLSGCLKINFSNTSYIQPTHIRSWGLRVFRVFKHQTPLPRWLSRGWSVPRLHHSSTRPQAYPLNPEVIWSGIFSCLTRSVLTCQSMADARRPVVDHGYEEHFSPALTKAISFKFIIMRIK